MRDYAPYAESLFTSTVLQYSVADSRGEPLTLKSLMENLKKKLMGELPPSLFDIILSNRIPLASN